MTAEFVSKGAGSGRRKAECDGFGTRAGARQMHQSCITKQASTPRNSTRKLGPLRLASRLQTKPNLVRQSHHDFGLQVGRKHQHQNG
jgi:hypothetical protein